MPSQPWSIELDGVTYSYFLPTGANAGDRTLANIARGLEEKIAGQNPEYTVTAESGATIHISGLPQDGREGLNPFTFGVSRGGGIARHVFDIDHSILVTGYQSFFNWSDPNNVFRDNVEYLASPTLELLSAHEADENRIGNRISYASDNGFLDTGSTTMDDPMLVYDFDLNGDHGIGTYYLRVSSVRDYESISLGGMQTPGSVSGQGVAGVEAGIGYNLIVSAQYHEQNPNALDLADPDSPATIQVSNPDGGMIEATIGGYDPVQKVFILQNAESGNDAAGAGVIAALAESDPFSLFGASPLGYSSAGERLQSDRYDLVLTSQPHEGEVITVRIDPQRTQTLNSDEAFNPALYFGEQYEEQVEVATGRAVVRFLEGATFAETYTLILTPVAGTEDSVSGISLEELRSNLPTGYEGTLDPDGGTITIESESSFYVSVESGEADSATTATGEILEVEFLGVTEVGQEWELVLDETTTLLYTIMNAASVTDEVIDEWVDEGNNVFTYTATSNRNPRITDVVTEFANKIITDATLSFEVERFSRILRLHSTATGTESAPSVTVTVDVGSSETGSAEVREIRAEVHHEVIFDEDNWNVAQTVFVSALDDDFIDGGDRLVFAPLEERVNGVRGPITVNGGFGGNDERFLNDPVLLPGETNESVADGLIGAIGGIYNENS
ncbi:MAG: hypothetical protein QF405_09945, partial [Roseibacillus sp.]|nr:hypothetical protein [Roseibacillus sp.]